MCTPIADLVACTVTLHSRSLTIVSVYVSPFCRYERRCISALRQQFSGGLLIPGDFNAHRPAWGRQHSSSGGVTLASEVESTDLIILKDGHPTYFGDQ